MEGFTQKSLKTSRGFTYTYYVSQAPSSPTNPALFFTHGWPDEAALWHPIATRLLAANIPFKLIIPDLLGFGGSDKPSATEIYAHKHVTADLREIATAEDAAKVIAVGHDWGAMVAARFYNYHPDMVVGLILLNVAYAPPSADKFDLDAVNALTTQAFGYPIYGYWHFFTSDQAPAIMQANADRLFATIHAKDDKTVGRFFASSEQARKFLEDHSTPLPEVREYAKDPAFRSRWIDRLSKDGFAGAQQFYVATVSNVQWEEDSKIPKEQWTVKVPHLYIGCAGDPVCRVELLEPSRPLLPDLEAPATLDSGHWSPYEVPDECARLMGDWLKRKFVDA